MSIVLGVDPGISGAMAFLDTENATMRLVDMPIFEFETSRKQKKIDAFTICREVNSQPITSGYVEEVHASPQMGVVSAFSFGEGKGIFLGALAALGIPTTFVRPTDWKKQMRVPADKRASVQRASQLFPDMAHLFKGPRGGIIDGRAEAAIIALFGALELGMAPRSSVKPVE